MAASATSSAASALATRSSMARLFASAAKATPPARAWKAADFKQVDDSVRGGSSKSEAKLSEDGEFIFEGFLDTTTLGGAGFASQQYIGQPPFPITLKPKLYSGIQLQVRPSHPPTTGDPQPGGGKGPVESYVFNLYPNEPVKRPDGRTQSSITFEHTFNLTKPSSRTSTKGGTQILSFDLLWSDFKPFYRGRPVDDADPLRPQDVKLWSLMARSDFGAQSGPFSLQVSSITTLPAGHQNELNAKSLIYRSGHATPWQEALKPATMTGSTGFALFLFATLGLTIWVIWALTPDHYLRAMGIDWYPNREWACLLPSFSILIMLLAYISYLAINLRMTPALDDLKTMTDSHANLLPLRLASDMTFEEAKRYYQEEHPLRPNASNDEKRATLDREIWDLPVYGLNDSY